MCRSERNLPMPDDGHDLYDRVRGAESDHGEPYDLERYEAWVGPTWMPDALLEALGGRRDA